MSQVLAKLIQHVELSSIEEAAGGDEWWGSLPKLARKAYIKKHPNSKYAKKMNAPYSGEGKSSSADKEEKKSSGVKLRGPKALQVTKPSVKKTTDKKSTKIDKEEKPEKVSKKPIKQNNKTKPKVVDKKVKKKSVNRGRPTSVSPKEMAKRIQARIKSLTDRITLLNAEKSYRNIARSFTKRETTKERLNERIVKINEMIKAAQAKIKSKQKHLQTLQKVR